VNSGAVRCFSSLSTGKRNSHSGSHAAVSLVRSWRGLFLPHVRATLDDTALVWRCVTARGVIGMRIVRRCRCSPRPAHSACSTSRSTRNVKGAEMAPRRRDVHRKRERVEAVVPSAASASEPTSTRLTPTPARCALHRTKCERSSPMALASRAAGAPGCHGHRSCAPAMAAARVAASCLATEEVAVRQEVSADGRCSLSSAGAVRTPNSVLKCALTVHRQSATRFAIRMFELFGEI
jgi:hypothetical protein